MPTTNSCAAGGEVPRTKNESNCMHYYSPGDRVYRQIANFQTFTRSYQTILAYRTTDSLNVPSFLFQTLWPIGKILENRTKKLNVFCFILSFVALWCQMVGKYFLWIILRGLLIKIRSQYSSEDDVTIVKLFFGLAGRRDWWRAGRRCGGEGVQHNSRGPKGTHAQVDAPHMTWF